MLRTPPLAVARVSQGLGGHFLKNHEKSHQDESKSKDNHIKYIRDTYGDSCDSPCLISWHVKKSHFSIFHENPKFSMSDQNKCQNQLKNEFLMKKYVDLCCQIISGFHVTPEIRGPKIEKIMFSGLRWVNERTEAMLCSVRG